LHPISQRSSAARGPGSNDRQTTPGPDRLSLSPTTEPPGNTPTSTPDRINRAAEPDARYFELGLLPDNPVFRGLCLSDLYYRRPGLTITQIVEASGRPVENGFLGVIPAGNGRIIYIQPTPDQFDDPWQKSKVLRVYSTILTNLGVRINCGPDFSLRGGRGTPEEWLPGFRTRVPDIDNRPTVAESPVYWKPALDFDPDVHYVW